jgi:hypothetical protein
MPAHAHLNLQGWVSLFLFGIYYHLQPAVDLNRLALVQVWIWIVGAIVLTIGVGLVHSGHAVGDPIAAVSSLVVLADTLIFGWLVFRREPAELARPRSTVPAHSALFQQRCPSVCLALDGRWPRSFVERIAGRRQPSFSYFVICSPTFQWNGCLCAALCLAATAG